ncbi:MAG: hypothetical protein JW982_16370 [Spirochaetes bacterium]|nr:hypothetical protein [Spirochaetota bacterium]
MKDSFHPEIPTDDIDENYNIEEHTTFVNLHNLLKSRKPIDEIAEKILDTNLLGMDIEKKDTIDRFLDFIYFKCKTGVPHIISLAYPSQRMSDKELEKVIIELINVHLFPEIVFPILKFMARNVQNSDTNLYLAYLINSENIIKSIYDTFVLFRTDTQKFIDFKKLNAGIKSGEEDRSLNVKRIQQFSSHTDDRFSSPLDAACRFKYVLEYIAMNSNVESIYTKEDLKLSNF